MQWPPPRRSASTRSARRCAAEACPSPLPRVSAPGCAAILDGMASSYRPQRGFADASERDRAAGVPPAARRLVPPIYDLSHVGLEDVDPWIPRPEDRAAGRPSVAAAIWPWGLRGLADTLEVVALALLMFILVRGVAQNFVVDGGSMEPTFSSGQMLIVNKLAYSEFDLAWLPAVGSDDWRPFGALEIGDVIVFEFPARPGPRLHQACRGAARPDRRGARRVGAGRRGRAGGAVPQRPRPLRVRPGDRAARPRLRTGRRAQQLLRLALLGDARPGVHHRPRRAALLAGGPRRHGGRRDALDRGGRAGRR